MSLILLISKDILLISSNIFQMVLIDKHKIGLRNISVSQKWQQKSFMLTPNIESRNLFIQLIIPVSMNLKIKT